jgi:Integrase core domain
MPPVGEDANPRLNQRALVGEPHAAEPATLLDAADHCFAVSQGVVLHDLCNRPADNRGHSGVGKAAGQAHAAFEGGNCYDNASVEACPIIPGSLVAALFKSLKAELIWWQKWHSRRQAETAMLQYINGFYNTRRRHSYLSGISPLAFAAKVA